MTVGKVVDTLLERKIVMQEKESRTVAGRRAGLISLNRLYFSMVLDLTRKQFRMTVIDAMIETVDRIEYDYNPEYYYEENLYIFLKNVKIYILRHLNMAQCMGIGILVPGIYDKRADCVRGARSPELADINLTQVVQDILGEPVSIITDDIASAAALTSETANRKAVTGIEGDAYVKHSTDTIIGEATSLDNADVKLATKLKAVSDDVDTIKGDKTFVKSLTVNNVPATVANNAATVTIDGADIKLDGYTMASDGGTLAPTDTINAALGKIEYMLTWHEEN